MEQMLFQTMEPVKSREEKLKEAKMMFHASSLPASEKGPRLFPAREEEEDFFEPDRPRLSFGFYRFLSALMLLGILITAFHFQVSYRGFSRERIEQMLSDDTHYQKLVKQAELVIRQIEPEKKETE